MAGLPEDMRESEGMTLFPGERPRVQLPRARPVVNLPITSSNSIEDRMRGMILRNETPQGNNTQAEAWEYGQITTRRPNQAQRRQQNFQLNSAQAPNPSINRHTNQRIPPHLRNPHPHDSYPPGFDRAVRSSISETQPVLTSPSPQRQLYNPNGEQARQNKHIKVYDPKVNVQGQVAYLDTVAIHEIPKIEMSRAEFDHKQALRLLLEAACRKVVAAHEKDANFMADTVELKCFGSLSTTFATKSSDMDLVLLSPQSKPVLSSPESEIPRLIEKALLESGYGARLLTKTRVPIIRFCEIPTPELVDLLKEERFKWETERETHPTGPKTKREIHPTGPKTKGKSTRKKAGPELTEPAKTQHPANSVHVENGRTPRDVSTSAGKQGAPEPHRLEFPKDGVGIQCDINFSNLLALHNSHLLRCYSLCDPRVRRMVLFVKAWSKQRKINSPYHGTLSSYGYVLMVLHYLVNIAQPPVLPNLQTTSQAFEDELSMKETVLDGYNILFFRNEDAIEQLRQKKWITTNEESLGSLLRGFFHYYAQTGYSSPAGGFQWTQDTLSLRTVGGILPKRSKGWTGAKTETVDISGSGPTQTKEIRQRYLFAIEDPFEIEHNIARTVVHNGIVAIRDEFRRAHRLIENAGKIPGRGEEDLFKEAEDKENLQYRAFGPRPRRDNGPIRGTEREGNGPSMPSGAGRVDG